MPQPPLKESAERVYDAIYEEEDARVCRDISESACSNVPQNFFLNASAVAFGKLADALANTKTTLPWLSTSILTCVIFFSLARGFCSVAAKDVMGKTVPKTRRGRVNGLSASVAGVGTVIAAAVLYHLEAGVATYSSLIVSAGVFWLLAAWLYARVEEEPGALAGGVNGLSEAFSSLALLRDDAPFRNFVIGRAFLVGTALSAPFLVIMAQQQITVNQRHRCRYSGCPDFLSGTL